MATVDISLLTETAVRRQKDLKMLPYAVLAQTLGLHGITLYPGIQNKDVITNFERKQGIMAPYAVGQTVVDKDIAKTHEMVLEVMEAYASVKDNINSYKTIDVGPDVLLGKMQSKTHPWNVAMLFAIATTFSEDILDALFPAERNTGVLSPLGCFDGYDQLIDDFITAAKIRISYGNLRQVGSLAAPTTESDVAAYASVLAFYRGAHPSLRGGESLLLMPYAVADAYDSAFFNKFRYKPTEDNYGRTILDGSNGKCKIVRSNIMGTGDRMILTAPGNLHFGMDTLSDSDFVQVRNPYEDPNLVQFWIQGKYGTRIGSIHEKVFMISDGTPVGLQLSGDYS